MPPIEKTPEEKEKIYQEGKKKLIQLLFNAFLEQGQCDSDAICMAIATANDHTKLAPWECKWVEGEKPEKTFGCPECPFVKRAKEMANGKNGLKLMF